MKLLGNLHVRTDSGPKVIFEDGSDTATIQMPPGGDLDINGGGSLSFNGDALVIETDPRLTDARTPLPHTIASHSDTTATGAQLDTLVGGGNTTLHDHAGTANTTFSIDSGNTRGSAVFDLKTTGNLWLQNYTGDPSVTLHTGSLALFDGNVVDTISTDVAMGGGSASNSVLSTQLAVKTYVDNQIGGINTTSLINSNNSLVLDNSTDPVLTLSGASNSVVFTLNNVTGDLTKSGGGDVIISNGDLIVGSTSVALSNVQVNAGNGLTGGGTIGSDVTLNVASHAGSAGSIGTLVVGTDDVGVALGSTATTAAPGNHIHSTVQHNGTQMTVSDGGAGDSNITFTDGSVTATMTLEPTAGYLDFISNDGTSPIHSNGTAVILEGDTRLTDARTPTAHDHAGTSSTYFDINTGSSGVRLKASGNTLTLRNLADSADADIVVGNLTVLGTTTTVNSETLTVADNIIEINSNIKDTVVSSQDGGITVIGGKEDPATWRADGILHYTPDDYAWYIGYDDTPDGGSIVKHKVARKAELAITGGTSWGGVTGAWTLGFAHNLGTQDVVVQVWDGLDLVQADNVNATTVDQITVQVASKISSGRIVVIG